MSTPPDNQPPSPSKRENPLLDPVEPHLPQNPSLFPGETVRPVGNADLSPPGHPSRSPSTEGMLIGPDNPLFYAPSASAPGRGGDLNVPPGARYDPIAPAGVGIEPDFDEFLPPQTGAQPAGRVRGRGRGQGQGGRIIGNPFDSNGSSSGTGGGHFNPFNGM